MPIGGLIATYASTEYAAEDDAAVVAKLNAATIEHVDNDLYTWAGIALHCGHEACEQLRVAMDSNNMGWAVHQLGGSGLQISSPLVKPVIEGFIAAGIALQPLLDAVFASVSPAMEFLGASVVEQDIADYRLSALKKHLEDIAVDSLQAYREALASWDGTGDAPVLGGRVNGG